MSAETKTALHTLSYIVWVALMLGFWFDLLELDKKIMVLLGNKKWTRIASIILTTLIAILIAILSARMIPPLLKLFGLK